MIYAITQARLSELFDYCPESGILAWKSNRGVVKAGAIAGTVHINQSTYKSYRRICLQGKRYMAHRIIWKMLHGVWPDQIDHKDGNGLNNKLDNLRDCSRVENNRNKRLFKNNTSGCTGVRQRKSKNWRASGSYRVAGVYRSVPLGTFVDFFEAVCARKSWESKNGFHVNHGVSRPL